MDANGGQLTKVIDIKRIINTTYYNYLPDVSQELEALPGWKLLYAEQGKLRVHADQDDYILKSGEMICLAPMKEHCIKSYQGKASAIMFRFEASCELPGFSNRVFCVNQQQKYYLDEILSIGKQQLSKDCSAGYSACYDQILKNSIELLMLSLIYDRKPQQQEQGDLSHRSAQHKNITNDIIQHLNDTVREPVKLQDIADKFSYSLSSIKRIFKNETGLSIIDYQNNNRISLAKHLLETSNTSIEEISDSLGFSNSCYFSRTFKKRVGISPSAYRKSIRNAQFFEE